LKLPSKYNFGFDVEIKTEQAHLFRIDDILDDFASFLEEQTNNKTLRTANTIQFTHANPLFLFSYKAFIEIKLQGKLTVNYKFSISELIQIVVLLILFIVFFSQYTLHQYLVVSGLFVVVFFVFNLLVINSDLYKLLVAGAKKIIAEHESEFSQEQQEWLANDQKCPACGLEITIYDKHCPDCGIKLRDKVPIKPYSISGDYQTVKYHLRV